MQSDILKKIDALVDMAGTSSNIDTLKAELNEIEKESDKLKSELRVLSDGNILDKYFKASEKQVDENIKVSLEAKIKRQEKSLCELQNNIDSVVLDEETLHNELDSLKETITSINNYISTLNERLATISDVVSIDNYKKIIEAENKKLDELVGLLNKKQKEYDDIFDKLNILNQAKEEMNGKLVSDKDKLAETKANLVNPSFYVDLDLKRLDDERINSIRTSLADLDKRKLEIITDPAMIADEAKSMILDDDRTSALSRIKELVTIVKFKPYMDVPSGVDLEATLEEALENATNARDEFAALIDTKDYTGLDNKVIEDRISYLNEETKAIEDKINALKSEVSKIDNEMFVTLNVRLNHALEVKKELEECLDNYDKAINKNGEEQTPKRRAVLSSAYQKKQEELENIKKVIENYKKEQEKLVKKAFDIESSEIAFYENEIATIANEIKELNNLLLSSPKTKDVLAIENDKAKLKELDENVRAIKHRKKYSQNPSEIFDEIEMYLGTVDVEPKKEEVSSEFNVADLNYNYDLNDAANLDLNSYSNDDIVDVPEIKSEEVINELPDFEIKDESSEKLKVVNVEPLEEKNKDVEQFDNPFIIGDYKDDDFMEVDNIFGNGDVA